MWTKLWSHLKTPGPTTEERLLNALLEQNALLRQMIELQGGVPAKAPRISTQPPRKATAKDVSWLSREDLLKQQIAAQASVDEKKVRSSNSGHPPNRPHPNQSVPPHDYSENP